MLIGQAREAVERQAPAEEARQLASEMQQVVQSLTASRASQPGAEGPGAPDDAADDSDDVVDADFKA
jgi:hypothetical protein